MCVLHQNFTFVPKIFNFNKKMKKHYFFQQKLQRTKNQFGVALLICCLLKINIIE
jgi:hypothetical protein